MIHSLRQRHRQTVITLGVLLPVAFIVGIAVRKPLPLMETTPAAFADKTHEFTVTVWKQTGLFTKLPVEMSLLRKSENAGAYAVSFQAPKDFVQPDLLVYGVPGTAAITDTLPDNAVLLGEFSSPTLPVPDTLAATNGVILLYSLANGQIVDVSHPVQFNRSKP